MMMFLEISNAQQKCLARVVERRENLQHIVLFLFEYNWKDFNFEI